MTIQRYHQFRTLDQIYVFQFKESQTLSLKVYNLAYECIFKASEQISSSDFQSLIPRALTLLSFFSKKTPPPFSAPNFIQDPLVELKKFINLIKLQIPQDNSKVESLTCPLTLEILKNPVMDNCGHTFEKDAIEQHLKNDRCCPLSRKPIDSLTPNLHLKSYLEIHLTQDPIPTLALFKKENSTLAQAHLQVAKTSLEEKEYQAALDAYSLAFQYTKRWQDYQPLPSLYEQMGMMLKAQLALLYLACYQLEAQDIPQTLKTLEALLKYPGFSNDLSLQLLCKHLSQEPHSHTTISFDLETVKTYHTTQPQKAQLIYSYLLNQNPHHWEAYFQLSDLLLTPSEKAHILLRGACHAIEASNVPMAEKFCQQALEYDSLPFLNHIPHFQVLGQSSSQLIKKLTFLAENYAYQNDHRSAVKAYRYLIHLHPAPVHYIGFLRSQIQLPKIPKTFSQALIWIKDLIQKKEYSSAREASEILLKVLPHHPLLDSLPLYQNLIEVHTALSSPQLQNSLNRYAEIQQQQGNLALAEKSYRQAFEKFSSYEQATKLAQILSLQPGKTSEAVQCYYEAAFLSLLQSNSLQLSQTIDRLLQIDPTLQYLQITQKIQILTQKQLCEVRQDLMKAQHQISELQNEREQMHSQLHHLQTELIRATTSPPQTTSSSSALTTSSQLVHSLPNSASSTFIGFGVTKWATYFGDVGAEPPLPPTIHQILSSPCPIWPDKTVQETHLLVLIPQTINGNPLNLKTIGELIKTPKQGHATQYRTFQLGEYLDPPAGASHWVLMTRDVIPGSRHKRYHEQQLLVRQLPPQPFASYQVPNVLDAVVCVLMEYVQSGKRLLGNAPWVYTRCQEKFNNNDWQLIVGGFSEEGLGICNLGAGPASRGMAAVRKF